MVIRVLHIRTPPPFSSQYWISRSLNINLSFGRLIYCSIPLCAVVVQSKNFQFGATSPKEKKWSQIWKIYSAGASTWSTKLINLIKNSNFKLALEVGRETGAISEGYLFRRVPCAQFFFLRCSDRAFLVNTFWKVGSGAVVERK